MIRTTSTLVLLFMAMNFNPCYAQNEHGNLPKQKTKQVIYSANIGDSMTIFIDLPNDYDPAKKNKYPVVYLLDANLYFDIMATTLNKYSRVDLAPSVILVGIGYKDLETMDQLRDRDYTFPKAFKEYDMKKSGGADKFLAFLSTELLPYIDKGYKTDTTKRVLAGHSLGGFFTMYALLQNLQGNNNSFSSYIAASPSFNYNKYYLLNAFTDLAQQKSRGHKLQTYITYGGLEDEEDADEKDLVKKNEIMDKLSAHLAEKQSGSIVYKADIFSNLGHMDAQLPCFIKGIRWALPEGK